METRAILRALCAAAMLFVGLAQANGPAPETPDAYLAERAIGKVEETTQRAYGDALASFEAARKQAPDDIGLAVSHCRFLQHYTDPESGNWMLGADEAFQSCSGQLHARWPDAPQVQLFDLNALWGEAAATRGEAIIKSADRWPVTFRRELLSKTSEGHEQDGNATRAGELVLMAVRLGDVSRLGAAAQYLSSVKKFDQAADLLAKA